MEVGLSLLRGLEVFGFGEIQGRCGGCFCLLVSESVRHMSPFEGF